jgi:hypothetical protein
LNALFLVCFFGFAVWTQIIESEKTQIEALGHVSVAVLCLLSHVTMNLFSVLALLGCIGYRFSLRWYGKFQGNDDCGMQSVRFRV